MDQHRSNDDGDAEVERKIEFALLAEQRNREQDRIHGLEVDRELDGERTEMPQRDERQRERHERAREREHEQIEAIVQ